MLILAFLDEYDDHTYYCFQKYVKTILRNDFVPILVTLSGTVHVEIVNTNRDVFSF